MDRLLLLLDTGSTTSVRTTAAKQLAQLAAKSVISDVALEDDVKAHRHHQPLGDPSGWTELMAVIARVREYKHFRRSFSRVPRFFPIFTPDLMKLGQLLQMRSHRYSLSSPSGILFRMASLTMMSGRFLRHPLNFLWYLLKSSCGKELFC